jgi:hypothetical protein
MTYNINQEIIQSTSNMVDWYRKEQENPSANVPQHPQKDIWKKWDDNRLWCSLFFSIISPGGSQVAREYLEDIENHEKEFELSPNHLFHLDSKERRKAIWNFGKGHNRLGKQLARFFSKSFINTHPHNFEYKLGNTFDKLYGDYKEDFKQLFYTLNNINDERMKAKHIEEYLPGLKISRNCLNNIGMADTLIALDRHILSEMNEKWKWDVPKNTPSSRQRYEEIEDAVRLIAKEINCTVVEIDRSIFFYKATSWPSGHACR